MACREDITISALAVIALRLEYPSSRWPRVHVEVRGEAYKGARRDKVHRPKAVRVPNPEIDYSFDDGYHVSHPDAASVLEGKSWERLGKDGWFFVAAIGNRDMWADRRVEFWAQQRRERREYPIDWE